MRSGIGGIKLGENITVKCLHLQTAAYIGLGGHPGSEWLKSKGLCLDCGTDQSGIQDCGIIVADLGLFGLNEHCVCTDSLLLKNGKRYGCKISYSVSLLLTDDKRCGCKITYAGLLLKTIHIMTVRFSEIVTADK